MSDYDTWKRIAIDAAHKEDIDLRIKKNGCGLLVAFKEGKDVARLYAAMQPAFEAIAERDMSISLLDKYNDIETTPESLAAHQDRMRDRAEHERTAPAGGYNQNPDSAMERYAPFTTFDHEG